jgi:hypothetical protein
MFAGLCENFDFFNSHINLFVALAPVVRLDNCSSGIIKMMKDNDNIVKAL